MESLLFEQEELNAGNDDHYLVLARKYRPTTFSDMIGQDALIKTFTNAAQSNRIAHAFLLTGIRGVGKTTTARIIARALNCVGEDGKGAITTNPCGKCYHCVAIAEDRHQDVIEIDAASHTGVNDIREIIENARYRPTSARFKIYIIDEVHMLSNSAFNALLKTLEEPPMHVKFVFATTEIKKIPLTILSRCQRFDLKRVGIDELIKHFNSILGKEGFKADADCLKMIANAANGSVRDGLSILDQAISHTGGNITAASVREMLGLSSNEDLYALYENLLKNEVASCLAKIGNLYSHGADPLLITHDLMTITHSIAKAQADRNCMELLPEFDRGRVENFLKLADVSKINRIWMMLLKGFEEVRSSPNPMPALEMLLIRIMHLSNLPSPEDLIKKLKSKNDDSQAASQKQQENAASQPESSNQSHKMQLNSIEDVEKLLFEHDEMVMCHHLRGDVKLVKIEAGRIALNLLEGAPKNFHILLKEALERITGDTWTVLSSTEDGDSTIAQKYKAAVDQQLEGVKEHQSVKQMLKAFTGLEIADIKLQNN
ncbi:MAG: polymerase subunit gamma and tau [Candidatus Midichloriaceae bacterium]|jgi:DNA polymerase-3 subunit gamma/tau|nr:polymerase subunit gamma and tau [Candidatus Midichloriaceae bacterium]